MRVLSALSHLQARGLRRDDDRSGVFVKRAMPSRGDEDSDEVSLVAIFDGVKLESRAKAFKGGSMLAWFGGIDVDLTEVELRREHGCPCKP